MTNKELEYIERKQLEILWITQARERKGERKMKEHEKVMLKYLENKYKDNKK